MTTTNATAALRRVLLFRNLTIGGGIVVVLALCALLTP